MSLENLNGLIILIWKLYISFALHLRDISLTKMANTGNDQVTIITRGLWFRYPVRMVFWA